MLLVCRVQNILTLRKCLLVVDLVRLEGLFCNVQIRVNSYLVVHNMYSYSISRSFGLGDVTGRHKNVVKVGNRNDRDHYR